MQFDSNGNLNGGILNSTLKEVENHLVLNFPKSNTRKRNFNSLKKLIRLLQNEELIEGISKIWLDGSFCTTKTNPNDIDIVILTKPFQRQGDIIFNNGKLLREEFEALHLDLYFLPDFNVSEKHISAIISNSDQINNHKEFYELIRQYKLEYQAKYWMGQFGFDRLGNSKAIISIEGGGLND
ncbi:hypothetical protein J3T78_04775 [Staphylococcus nepalensis]|uniref:Polymerase nucleotidyl transferase domain-containing protein n=1 Tax=Staphylococcus nepalensis TaxID=214473 RepID=A0ABS3L2R4_9STAP|nr:hypothetical protein [Staphylococcus nepalensis]MBO1213758.1 hypothetical protein [Staphylococcus nepalensis]MBO1215020.1 hypothetical protein [Staphylococcus nepalensis]MBO1226976.1 hypothetical protein [Staphylococcus nepalensis]MBO1234090.1 hypothetical protein [Staphylococcus nepalensis]MBO1237022.1 hypothetical protein [Staphylococcus nepalensis]